MFCEIDSQSVISLKKAADDKVNYNNIYEWQSQAWWLPGLVFHHLWTKVYQAIKFLYCILYRIQQESLANAKGSARQPWYIVRKSPNRPPFRNAQHQRNLYIVEKYFQCATIPSLTPWVCLHSFSCCSRSNMPTSANFRQNLNVQQCKVIQGRWFWYQSKGHMRVPISH